MDVLVFGWEWYVGGLGLGLAATLIVILIVILIAVVVIVLEVLLGGVCHACHLILIVQFVVEVIHPVSKVVFGVGQLNPVVALDQLLEFQLGLTYHLE